MNLLFCFVFLRQGVFCVHLEPIMALTLDTRLAWSSQRIACLCLQSAGIKGICHQYSAKNWNLTTKSIIVKQVETGRCRETL